MKPVCDWDAVTSRGSLFQNLAAATGNARSPTVASRVGQTIRMLMEEERRRRREMSLTFRQPHDELKQTDNKELCQGGRGTSESPV